MAKNKRGKSLWNLPSRGEVHVRSAPALALSCCIIGQEGMAYRLRYARNAFKRRRNELMLNNGKSGIQS